MPFQNCLGCNEQKRSKNDRFFSLDFTNDPLKVINNLRSTFNAKKRKLDRISEIPLQSKICKSCYNISKQPRLQINYDSSPDLSIYRRGLNSHSRCIFGCKTAENLTSVPSKLQKTLLMDYKFFAQSDSRVCKVHIGTENYWPLVKQISEEVTNEDHKKIHELMSKYYHKDVKEAVFDFDDINSIKDETFKNWFGYTKDEFEQIRNYLKSASSMDLGIFLCKIRTALSNEQLTFLFGCCSQTISNRLIKASKDLLENLVPKFINVSDRIKLLNNDTRMARILFDVPKGQACCIFDATYRLAQKSKNFSAQKMLWSEQKKMPLVKPMVGCTPNGYITHVLGPYDANHNDAVILEDCFKSFETSMSVLEPGDFIFVDRGFRDVVQFLKDEKEFEVYMPGLGQLDTKEANKSRFVTKIRWVIEQVFGRLKKKFKYFAIPAHNATLSNDYSYLQIAFALLNLFHKPIYSDKEYDGIAQYMKTRLNKANNLKRAVEDYNLTQVKVPYMEIHYTSLDNEENNNLLQFPYLTMEELYYISLGPYQINNAISYYAEHKHEDIFLVHKFQPGPRHATARLNYSAYDIVVEDPLLVKAYMKSRYRGGKHHHIFVLADKRKIGRDSIVEYYCTCESGARTVGCCSHIMTIIWYLGYGQYNALHIPNPDLCDVSLTIPKKQNNPEID